MNELINTPLVSIIIPTYNRLPYLIEAIDSVINQTYKKWELIIADDGSTDGTQSYIRNLPNDGIHLVELSHSGNIASVRNAGVKISRGQWLAFLDSDDIWITNKLELQVHCLNSSGKKWGYGGFEMMNVNKVTINNKAGTYHPISGNIVKQLITSEASVAIGSMMVSKELFIKVDGFNPDPQMVLREDYDLALRLALEEDTIAIPNVLVRIREHELRSTNLSDDGHELTATVMNGFLKNPLQLELKELSRNKKIHHLCEAFIHSARKHKYLHSLKLLIKAIRSGAKAPLLFHSFVRSFKSIS